MDPIDLPEQPRAERLTAGAPCDAIAIAVSDHVAVEPDDLDDVLDDVPGPFETMILTLAMYGDDLDPDDVSRRMGCPPSTARRKGERVHAGVDSTSTYPTGVWRLEVRGDAFSHASVLVEQLLGRFPADAAFWQPFNRDFGLQLHLSIHDAARDCGFILSTEALARCAVTGASMLTTFHADTRPGYREP